MQVRNSIEKDKFRIIIGWLFIVLGIISIAFCLFDELVVSYYVGRKYNSRIVLGPLGIFTIYTGIQILRKKSAKILLILILLVHLLELIFNKVLSNGLCDGGLNEILYQIPIVVLILQLFIWKKSEIIDP